VSELSDAQCDLLLDAIRDGWRCPECGGSKLSAGAMAYWCDNRDCDGYCCGLRANWPPPARGTHSSDYPSPGRCPCADATTQTARNGPVPGQTYEAHLAEYEAAARWSRNEEAEPA
jgi:hypothetical protein